MTKHRRRVGEVKGLNMSKNPVARVWFYYTKSMFLDLRGECEDRGLAVEDVVSVTTRWAEATVTMRDGSTFQAQLWGEDDCDYKGSDDCYVADADGDDAAERVHMRSVGVDVKSDDDDINAD